MAARASRAEYKHEDVARVPRGWRVRTVAAGEKHEVRVAFPPGPRRRGSGKLISILHPKGENPECHVSKHTALGIAASHNPELLIFGNPNPYISPNDASKIIRRALRKTMPKLRVGHGRGTAYGYIEIRGSGPHGDFTEHESSELKRLGFTPGANFATISPDSREFWVKRLQESNPRGKTRISREEVREAQARYDVIQGKLAGPWTLPAEERRELEAQAKKLAQILRGAVRRNPSEEAEAVRLFRTFHGHDPKDVAEKHVSAAVRKDYTALGDLSYLIARTPLGQSAKFDFSGDGVKLASSPDGKQLYLIGGNQNLSRCLNGHSQEKDFVDLGDAVEVEYVARKVHGGYEPVSYYHKFGEKTGALPRLMYDRLRKQIFFVGGEYFIDTSKEISPGIEN